MPSRRRGCGGGRPAARGRQRVGQPFSPAARPAGRACGRGAQAAVALRPRPHTRAISLACPINRYPRLDAVSINFGCLASSPSAARSSLIVVFSTDSLTC